MKRMMMLLIGVTVLMTGCAKLNITEDDVTSEIIVKAATAEHLRKYPSHADNFADVTRDAMSAIDAKKLITIDELDAFVRAKANLDSRPIETQLMLDGLIKVIKKRLLDRISALGIREPSKAMVQARVILTWVNETATIYAKQPGRY